MGYTVNFIIIFLVSILLLFNMVYYSTNMFYRVFYFVF